MARTKTGFVRRRRHKRVIKLTKGQWGTRSKNFKRANEAMMRSLWYAYRDRRQRRRQLRRLWIQRINAAARMNGLKYSQLMHGLKKAGSAWIARVSPVSPCAMPRLSARSRTSQNRVSSETCRDQRQPKGRATDPFFDCKSPAWMPSAALTQTCSLRQGAADQSAAAARRTQTCAGRRPADRGRAFQRRPTCAGAVFAGKRRLSRDRATAGIQLRIDSSDSRRPVIRQRYAAGGWHPGGVRHPQAAASRSQQRAC